MNESTNLILASASPRRRELLGLFGIDFQVEPAAIDERWPPAESPADYVIRMATEKAAAVAARHNTCPVLGADTAVVVDGQCLGKPADAGEAADMLRQLSGRTHEVLSGVALALPDGSKLSQLSTTRVEFGAIPEAWIRCYVDSGDPMDKAGAYGIQGSAGIWVRRLDGSHSGVVGLPLYETGQLLREARLD